ncbi:MAG: hypothetical protein V1859_03245 [archaeon]
MSLITKYRPVHALELIVADIGCLPFVTTNVWNGGIDFNIRQFYLRQVYDRGFKEFYSFFCYPYNGKLNYIFSEEAWSGTPLPGLVHTCLRRLDDSNVAMPFGHNYVIREHLVYASQNEAHPILIVQAGLEQPFIEIAEQEGIPLQINRPTISDPIQDVWVNNGEFDDLRYSPCDSGYIPPIQYVREIDLHWKKIGDWLKGFLRSKDVPIYNGQLLRFEGVRQGTEPSVLLSCGVDYKTVTGLRAICPKEIASENNPYVFGVMTLLITSDDKFVVGCRNYYGDWCPQTFEMTGGFVRQHEIEGSVAVSARIKVKEDFKIEDNEYSLRVASVYNFHSIMEAHALCIARTCLTEEEIMQRNNPAYSNLAFYQMSSVGIDHFIRDSNEKIVAHYPTRRVIIYLCDNYHKYRHLIEK